MSILDRYKTNWTFFVTCCLFLKRNKDLLSLPISSFLLVGMFIISYFAIIANALIHSAEVSPYIPTSYLGIGLTSLFVGYFLISFIIVFFNTALVNCILARLDNKQASIFNGLQTASKKWWLIMQWSTLNATIGIFINALERSHNMIAEISGYLLGFSWAACSYFVLPILVNENLGPIAALKRSKTLFSGNWRKTVSINAIAGLIGLGLFFIFYCVFNMIGNISHAIHITHLQSIEVAILIGCLLLIIGFINSALNSTLKSAIYLYSANKSLPEAFEKVDMSQVIVRR